MTIINKAVWIRGITVRLHTQSEGERDELNRIIYSEEIADIDNVLVSPSTEEEIEDTLNLTGRKAIYTLGIPKGDTHDWTDKIVEFFGQQFRTIGSPVQGISEMIPLEWNKKVRCEVVNGEDS